jgi:hypothetical protein
VCVGGDGGLRGGGREQKGWGWIGAKSGGRLDAQLRNKKTKNSLGGSDCSSLLALSASVTLRVCRLWCCCWAGSGEEGRRGRGLAAAATLQQAHPRAEKEKATASATLTAWPGS